MISTRVEYLAMKELFQESDSYAENFNKLADTGCLCANEEKPLSEQLNGDHVTLIPHLPEFEKTAAWFSEYQDNKSRLFQKE